jgi:hypothetical protein
MTGPELDHDEAFKRAMQMNAMLGEYRRNAITAGRYQKRMREAYPAEYFETRFRVRDRVGWGGSNFVIISACSTTGTSRDPVREANADRELREVLEAFGCSPQRVVGYSPRTGHTEPSWAAPIGELEGVRVGARFAQDAIYLLRGDTLWVAACRDDRAPAPVGKLEELLDVME